MLSDKIKAALAAVAALGQRAVAIAQDADKPSLQQLHDDAASAVQTIETDAEDVGEATLEAGVVKFLTPTLGAEGAAKFAAVYCPAGLAAVAAKVGFSLPTAA